MTPMRSCLLLLAVVASGVTLPLSAQAPPAALMLVGDAGQSKVLTMTELEALPQAVVTVTEPDSTRVTFRGPTLRDLVAMVGAPAGQALRGPNLLLAVVAEAADGYRVAYLLADLDPRLGNRTAILALTQDGRPLDADHGPLQIVVPGEAHHARWIRRVVRLRLAKVGE